MRKIVAIAGILVAVAALVALIVGLRSKDPRYTAEEVISLGRFDRYDDFILGASKRYGMPPELIKAVIWKESRFHPDKVGQQGERGLMQVTEGAATDWAKAEKIETFATTDLFDPKVNIEAGTWYLARAMSHWAGKDNPESFALAEYNAGRTRVKRWVKDSGQGETASAEDLRAAMDFPGTKSYVAAILNRMEFYKARTEFNTP